MTLSNTQIRLEKEQTEAERLLAEAKAKIFEHSNLKKSVDNVVLQTDEQLASISRDHHLEDILTLDDLYLQLDPLKLLYLAEKITPEHFSSLDEGYTTLLRLQKTVNSQVELFREKAGNLKIGTYVNPFTGESEKKQTREKTKLMSWILIHGIEIVRTWHVE